MKKNIIIIIFLITSNSYILSQSTWKISLKAGPNISKFIYDTPLGSGKYGMGLSTGFDFYRFKKEHLFFKTGINYNLKVTNQTRVLNSDTTFEGKSKGSHVIIPLLLGYRFNIKQHDFYFAGGMEIDYLFAITTISNLYGTAKGHPNGLDDLAPKYVLSFAYLNKLNEHYTLTINPEYVGGLQTNILEFGDRIVTWRLNIGIIYKY